MTTTIAPLAQLGLADLADRYDVILSDVWGVLHNGANAWPEAGDALARFRAKGGVVVLVSNAPRPSEDIVPQLLAFGVPREAWDGFVSSGDLTRREILRHAERAVHHIGPQRDVGLFDDLAVARVGVDQADVAIVTGLHDDETETPEDYRGTLEQLLARKVPMICANPDLIVERGDSLLWCAGAIADLYEKMGGDVTWFGKPHPAIYQAALEIAAAARKAPVDLSRVLAVGDAVRTDLAGANRLGVDCLFMTGGIHGKDLGDPPHPDALATLLAPVDRAPVGWAKRLAWRL
jgi:HAD superfamily hydrolase (TIGR01459 family)